MDLLEISYLCSYLVLRQCNSVVPLDWKDYKDVSSWHCQQATLWLYFILCEPLCTSQIILGGVVFGFGVFFWVWVFLEGYMGGGAGGRGIAELKVKISQQSFKDMPTQKNGSEEDT